MRFYLNIHVNLFPVYVLLLLLTLSHGRPSAKIREPTSMHVNAYFLISNTNNSLQFKSALKSSREFSKVPSSSLRKDVFPFHELATATVSSATSGWRLKTDSTSSVADTTFGTIRKSVEDKPHENASLTSNFLETQDEESEDVVKFRQNILNELGYQPDMYATRSFNNLRPPVKINVTREDILSAYLQYMQNVRRRKLDASKTFNHRQRRRNAVAKTITLHEQGTVAEEINGKYVTTFRFPVNLNQERRVRVRGASLSLDHSCTLLNPSNTSEHLEKTRGERNRVGFDLSSSIMSKMLGSSGHPLEIVALCPSSKVGTSASMRLILSELPEQQHNRSKRFADPLRVNSFKNKTLKGGTDCDRKRRGKSCCRRSMKITFADLGIADIIVEPKEFDAHICSGRCKAKKQPYASVHAMFQHIIHKKKGSKVAWKPCCSPTKLSELDVIHLDPMSAKFEVTVLQNAIVTECGCS